MRNLKMFFSFLAILLAGSTIGPRPARAQYIGTTSPQTVVATIATNQNCTGAAQLFSTGGAIPDFRNLGQTQHYVSTKTTGVQTLSVQIFGVDKAGNTFLLSETGTIGAPAVGNNPVVTGSGFYANIQVAVQCTPNTGTFTATYTGASATTNINSGGYLLSQEDKSIAQAAPANTGLTANFQAPYGSAQGYLSFTYQPGAGPAGSQLGINCVGANGTNFNGITINLTTATLQLYPTPALPCPIVTVTYVSGGATADTFSLDYVFIQPGLQAPNNYTHITGTTATEVKPGSGVLHSLVIGTPAAGTVSIFDLAPAQCTGTPITNIVSVITATTTFPTGPEIYDSFFVNGICVKASVAMDITVNTL